jgi:hypothetical protein
MQKYKFLLRFYFEINANIENYIEDAFPMDNSVRYAMERIKAKAGGV